MNSLTDISIAPQGGFKGLGTGVLSKVNDSGVSTFSKIISMAIGVLTLVGIIWFLFTLISGAIAIIGSGGDKQALESARKKITTGLIGLVIILAATFILDLVGTIFGIDFLDLNLLFVEIMN
ncbi:hypothetical protein A2434_03265 [Candidatus Woesebacteria bacterium RIFOXYC1_FULL_41_14]|nr:MAG: hypothetical protein A2434_03265 [Candidatus Woesebacteria bacterium RIFOXYC1_FULL_41_14]